MKTNESTELGPFEGLPDEMEAEWLARADAAQKVLRPYFAPSIVGLSYAGSHAAHLSVWFQGVTRDLGLIALPDLETAIVKKEARP